MISAATWVLLSGTKILRGVMSLACAGSPTITTRVATPSASKSSFHSSAMKRFLTSSSSVHMPRSLQLQQVDLVDVDRATAAVDRHRHRQCHRRLRRRHRQGEDHEYLT